MSRRAFVLPVVAVLIAAGAVGLHAWTGRGHSTSAGQGLASGAGASGLEQFDPEAVDDLSRQVRAERAQADQAYASWSSTHPRAHRDDFIRFALEQLPPPPGADRQKAELAELARLASGRTPGLIATAARYDRTGEVEIWDRFGGDLPKPLRRRLGHQLQEAQTLADTLSGKAKKQFARPSPYVVEPQLRPDKSAAASSAKVSYPSSHATYAYAQADILSEVDPAHASTYQEAAGQVVYSRLYMAGHYRSDVLAGAMLGRLIADYESDTQSAG